MIVMFISSRFVSMKDGLCVEELFPSRDLCL